MSRPQYVDDRRSLVSSVRVSSVPPVIPPSCRHEAPHEVHDRLRLHADCDLHLWSPRPRVGCVPCLQPPVARRSCCQACFSLSVWDVLVGKAYVGLIGRFPLSLEVSGQKAAFNRSHQPLHESSAHMQPCHDHATAVARKHTLHCDAGGDAARKATASHEGSFPNNTHSLRMCGRPRCRW